MHVLSIATEVTPAILTTFIIGLIVQFVFNGAVSYWIYRAGRADVKIRDLRTKVETAQSQQHDLVTKLVDERFRSMSHEVQGHVQGLVTAVDDLRARLKDGDGAFDHLRERDHRVELQTQQMLAELKIYVVEHAASKEDLREHQASMGQKVDTLTLQINAVAAAQAVALRGRSGGTR